MSESSSQRELPRTGWLNGSNLIGGLFLVLAICLFFWGSLSENRMQDVFGKTTYYVLWIIFVVWIARFHLFLKSIDFSFQRFIRDHWPVLVLALILTAITAVANPPKFRVLSDETNLASISRSMLENKSVYNFTIGKYYFYTFNPIIAEMDKRPMLFPFFVQLFHMVRGYTINNLFLLNLSLYFALLASVGILVRRTCGDPDFPQSGCVWVAAVLLVFSCPILTLTATSGGFDLLSAVFLGWTFVVLWQFIKLKTAESLAFLWMNLLLLAHTRYESFIFSVIIVLGLLLFKRLNMRLFTRFSHVYLVTPLALVPLIFQRILSRIDPPPGVDPFSVKYVAVNILRFFEAISDTTFFFPYPGLLLWLSLLLIPFLAVALFRRKLLSDKAGHRQLLYIVLACLGAYLVIVFSYFFGDSTHPASARFFVLPVVALALAPILAHKAWPRIFSMQLLLAGSIGLALLYFPTTSEDRFTQSLELIRETQHAYSFLGSLKNKNVIVISDRPGTYTALKYGASNFDYANRHKNEFITEFNNKLYSDIIVLQHINYTDHKPVPTEVLDPEFVLNPPLAEHQITGTYYLRISNLKKREPVPPPEANR